MCLQLLAMFNLDLDAYEIGTALMNQHVIEEIY